MPIDASPMVPRAQMSRLFGALASQRFIFISAPAGYGKTMAMHQWQKLCKTPGACISLDEYDNNISRFCRSFCAALRLCQPQNDRLGQFVLRHLFEASPEEYTFRAINSLRIEEPAILAIDDLHILHDESTLRLLCDFLDRLPESFHVMLASRSELPSILSPLLTKHDCFTISAEYLRFVPEDIVRLYEKHEMRISLETAREIEMYTRGWAIGIKALLLSRGAPDGNRLDMLDDFIAKSVWSNYDAKTREFMLNTAILNALLPPLCAVLTGDNESDVMLERIFRQGAFIYKTARDVYKYHDLFCDFLLRELKKRGESYTFSLYDKAGAWYLARREFYSALDCFSKSGNKKGIAECFLTLTESASEFAGIEQLLSAASSPCIHDIAKEYPYIYSILMWKSFNKGQSEDMEHYADQYYANQARIECSNPRYANTTILLKLIDYRNSLKDLSLMVVKTLMLKRSADMNDILASPGIINQNMPLMHRGTRDISECAKGNASRNIIGLGKMLGKLLGGHGDVLVKCACSGILYEQSHLEEALSYAQNANAAIKANFSPEVKFIAMATQAYALDALDRNTEGDDIIEAIRLMIENECAYYLSYNYRALCARREIARGNTGAATAWLNDYGTRLHEDSSFYKSYGHITTCRAHMLLGDYYSAIILLQKLLSLYSAYRRPIDIIETKILLAIAYYRKNSVDESFRLLDSALLLAHEYAYTRLFVNEGSQLADMLLRMVSQSSDYRAPVDFITSLCMIIQSKANACNPDEASKDNTPYTDKQLHVMRLLCEGKSYKEISEEMNIKIASLRSHISIIYKKLNVSGEVEAVNKIKSLKLFS